MPTIRGVIDRRVLVNYRVEPAALERVLPEQFSPQTVNGHGVAGVCLVRFRDLRPKGLLAWLGVGSENAAHRIAVEWDAGGERQAGVYVPRRDTDLPVNTLLGGRLFPGVHHCAAFDVREGGGRYDIGMHSEDGGTRVRVVGERAAALPADSVFDSLGAASRFFEQGPVGHSPNERTGEHETLELDTDEWAVEPLAVERVVPSYFESFPGDAAFDHALLMRDIAHECYEGDSACAAPADAGA